MLANNQRFFLLVDECCNPCAAWEIFTHSHSSTNQKRSPVAQGIKTKQFNIRVETVCVHICLTFMFFCGQFTACFILFVVVEVVSIWREMYQGVRNSKVSCRDQGHYVFVCEGVRDCSGGGWMGQRNQRKNTHSKDCLMPLDMYSICPPAVSLHLPVPTERRRAECVLAFEQPTVVAY